MVECCFWARRFVGSLLKCGLMCAEEGKEMIEVHRWVLRWKRMEVCWRCFNKVDGWRGKGLLYVFCVCGKKMGEENTWSSWESSFLQEGCLWREKGVLRGMLHEEDNIISNFHVLFFLVFCKMREIRAWGDVCLFHSPINAIYSAILGFRIFN